MKKHKVTLTYRVTDACQRREALEGRAVPIEHKVTIEIPLDEALDRKVADIATDGEVIRAFNADQNGRVVDGDGKIRQYDHVPSADEVLADWRAQYMAELAQESAKRDAARAVILAWLREDPMTSKQDTPAPNWVETADGRRALISMADDPAAVSREARRRYEAQAAARREAEAADMREWIASHGSERLRLAMELGELDKMDSVYHAERRAHDIARLAEAHPGWQPTCSSSWGAEPPSEAALRALAEVRRTFPGARLIRDFGRDAIRVDAIPGFERLGPCCRFVD